MEHFRIPFQREARKHGGAGGCIEGEEHHHQQTHGGVTLFLAGYGVAYAFDIVNALGYYGGYITAVENADGNKGSQMQQDVENNMAALFKIGYGLYVVTSKDGDKDNGCIVNSVTQLTTTPNRVAVNINKKNYTHDIVKATGIMNVNCLDVSAPFAVFQNYGFQTGRTADKFVGVDELRSDNGLRFLPRYINAFMSLKVENYVDMDTHGLFICSVTEARVISDKDTMTYAYYQKNVKPKPATEGKKGYVCTVCGWIYEGDPLPEDIVCPLCKHGAADFEPIKN